MTNEREAEVRDFLTATVAYSEGEGNYLNAESLVARVRSWAVTLGCLKAGPASLVFLDDPGDGTEGTGRYEVWVPVRDDAKTTPDDAVQVKQTPAGRAAVYTLTGPHDLLQVAPLYRELAQRLSARGLQRAGPARWVYEQDPARLGADETLVFEFVFPVTDGQTGQE